MQAMPMSNLANHMNNEPETLRGNWSSSWTVTGSVILLTLLLHVKPISSLLTIQYTIYLRVLIDEAKHIHM